MASSHDSAAHEATHSDHYEPPSQGLFIGGLAMALMAFTILAGLVGVYLAVTHSGV